GRLVSPFGDLPADPVHQLPANICVGAGRRAVVRLRHGRGAPALFLDKRSPPFAAAGDRAFQTTRTMAVHGVSPAARSGPWGISRARARTIIMNGSRQNQP